MSNKNGLNYSQRLRIAKVLAVIGLIVIGTSLFFGVTSHQPKTITLGLIAGVAILFGAFSQLAGKKK